MGGVTVVERSNRLMGLMGEFTVAKRSDRLMGGFTVVEGQID